MADITTGVEIDVNTNADEAMAKVDGLNESIKQGAKSGKEAYTDFRGETRGLTGDVLSLTKGTAEYSAQLAKLAAHKAQFAELREQMKALDPRTSTQAFAEFGKTGARAFSGIAGAAALAAGNDEKMGRELMKGFAIMQILESAESIGSLKKQANSIKTAAFQKLVTAGYIEETAAVSGATIAQGLLNAVTAAWPIALLILGIGALVTAVAAWNSHNEAIAESEQKKIDMLKEEAKAIEAAKGLLHDKLQNEIDLLTAQGASYEKIAAAKEKQRAADAEAVKEQIEGQERLIKAQQIKNKAEESEVPIMAAIWGYTLAMIGIDSGYNEARKKEAEERGKALKEELNDLEKLKNSYDNLTTVKPAEAQKDAADHYKKLQDERDKAAEVRKQKDIDNYVWQMEQTEKEYQEEAAAQKKRDEEAAKEDADATKAAVQRAKDWQKQDDEIEKEKTQKLKEEADKRKQIREDEAKAAKDVADALGSLADLLTAKGKQNTEAQKAIALIQIGIKEAVAIANVVAVATDPANPANLATGGIAAFANIAGGIAGVLASIDEAKKVLDGSSGASLGSLASNASQSAPQIGGSTQFGATPQTNGNGGTDYGYNGMIKTFVTQTDLNAAQSKQYYQDLNRRNK